MKTSVKQIIGNWDLGYALDKHTISSAPVGINEYGHTIFETTRTEVGEALYQLKYKADWSQIEGLATELVKSVCHRFAKIGMVVPMAASNVRQRQPVTELAKEVSRLLDVPYFDEMLVKAPNGKSLKDLNSKAKKLEALQGTLTVNRIINNQGKWNALLIDDLFHTGASLEAACTALKGYEKVDKIYVAALSWR
jgi:predicted amidophosphoribosyltransferase